MVGTHAGHAVCGMEGALACTGTSTPATYLCTCTCKLPGHSSRPGCRAVPEPIMAATTLVPAHVRLTSHNTNHTHHAGSGSCAGCRDRYLNLAWVQAAAQQRAGCMVLAHTVPSRRGTAVGTMVVCRVGSGRFWSCQACHPPPRLALVHPLVSPLCRGSCASGVYVLTPPGPLCSTRHQRHMAHPVAELAPPPPPTHTPTGLGAVLLPDRAMLARTPRKSWQPRGRWWPSCHRCVCGAR